MGSLGARLQAFPLYEPMGGCGYVHVMYLGA
jgi:hypothetical protein